ncbi:MAG TPA: response regulator [Chloroflexia bacterium]|nr:response regulator [Chloroflexia bacterium]
MELNQTRILIMDDEVTLRQAVGDMLQMLGYFVEGVDEGQETIEKYTAALEAGNPFDIVIMDLTIPGGMGAQETIQRLSAIDPDVNAVVSSGYPDDPVIANYKEYGFKGAIVKPFTLRDLRKTLASLTEQ